MVLKSVNWIRCCFFAGYEVEFPFAYKEKHFVNEEKVYKEVIWFTDRVEPVQSSLMAGIQLPYGATIKFKYYLTNFHNRDYIAMVDGEETQAIRLQVKYLVLFTGMECIH